MYTLFCQKKCGSNPPFPLTQQLYAFLKHTKARGLLVFPGYISRTDGSISDFLQAFLTEDNNSLVKYFGMGNQNSYKLKAGESGLEPKEALKKHAEVIADKKIEWLNIERNNKDDHRKMVFIFDIVCDEGDLLTNINKRNYTDFLEQIEVIGVAIGSSNFSYRTYSKPKKVNWYTAQAGEADLFMFKDDMGDQFIQDYVNEIRMDLERHSEQRYQKVLSRSETIVPADFFKMMLRESLEVILT